MIDANPDNVYVNGFWEAPLHEWGLEELKTEKQEAKPKFGQPQVRSILSRSIFS
jgi:hypothetical protein